MQSTQSPPVDLLCQRNPNGAGDTAYKTGHGEGDSGYGNDQRAGSWGGGFLMKRDVLPRTTVERRGYNAGAALELEMMISP